ncbi:site-specific DNA-methyltransferase [Fenollaria timonensis]|uniref:site-specific DNA-methyltransferase n=1 Tax=Fenollaria timonensis TaxID=1723384 RepID=UPI0026F33805|nr:site-specific DNA-methyltransferase [Fenollaria timonensis]
MSNLSQEKRKEMLEYINKLKEIHKDDESIIALEKIETALTEKKYGLVWEEHEEEVDKQLVHNIPVFTEVEEKKIIADENEGFNFLLEGDNLHSLKLLEKTHKGNIDVIYIDPPYNTKNKEFVYNDTRVGEDDMYRHSKWISFMSERLLIAKELMSDEGVIFISIDDNEQAQLKILCDDIFGEKNFIANIIRNTNSSKNQSLYISVSHEYCLVYSKDYEKLAAKHKDNKWETDKNNVDEYIQKVKQLQKLGLSHEEITKELKELTKYPRFIDFTNYWYFDERGLYQKADLGGVKNGNKTPIINPLTNKEDPVPPGGFRYNAEKLQELIDDNRIHFHTDGSLPRLKRYLLENKKQRPKSIMSDDQRPDYTLLKKMNIDFDNPKQLTFMKRILGIFDENTVYLDFFAGSGTTGHAVMQLNKEDGGKRKYILCTNNENKICEEVTYKRLRNIQDDLPHNLKYFKTDFTPKFTEDEDILSFRLLDHIKEMVELENMCEIDGENRVIILSDENLKQNIEKIKDEAYLYMPVYILLSTEVKKLIEKKKINLVKIPEYYFMDELREANEI